MGCTPEAIHAFQKAGILFAPGKAVNAGGVATSGLEMTQNCMHISWSGKEVDEKLHFIMASIHDACVKFGKQKDGHIDYVKGANIAGFMKVAQALLEQGVLSSCSSHAKRGAAFGRTSFILSVSKNRGSGPARVRRRYSPTGPRSAY